MVNLLDNVKRLCNEKGISVPKVEKALEFGRGAIYQWDKHSPSIKNVEAVAQYLGVSVQRLIDGKLTETVKTEPVKEVRKRMSEPVTKALGWGMVAVMIDSPILGKQLHLFEAETTMSGVYVPPKQIKVDEVEKLRDFLIEQMPPDDLLALLATLATLERAVNEKDDSTDPTP
jgi:transcriptional regulator with XRE-family HTH domain